MEAVKKEENSAPAKNQTPIQRASRPPQSHYASWATPAPDLLRHICQTRERALENKSWVNYANKHDHYIIDMPLSLSEVNTYMKRKANHSLPSCAKVKNTWSNTSTLPQTFTPWRWTILTLITINYYYLFAYCNWADARWQRLRTCKGKGIPLQAWTGPEGSRRMRLPDFKTVDTWRW